MSAVVTKKPKTVSVIWLIMECVVCYEKWPKRLDEPVEQKICPNCNHLGIEIDRYIKREAA